MTTCPECAEKDQLIGRLKYAIRTMKHERREVIDVMIRVGNLALQTAADRPPYDNATYRAIDEAER